MNKQLLYLWIYNDERGCFKKSEFNFNPLFKFHFDVETNSLELKETGSKINIFDNGNLCNLTAIIGNNGVGKTTLFERIWNLLFASNEITKTIGREEYNDYEKYQKENSYYICVIWEDKESFKIINNFNRPIFFRERRIMPFSIKQNNVLRNITRVYFSFSSYGNSALSSSYYFEDHNKYFLNPESIVNEGNLYLNRLTPIFKRSNYTNELFTYFRSNFHFENILIAKSLCQLDDNHKLFKIGNNVKFSILNLTSEIMYNPIYRESRFHIMDNLRVKDRVIDETQLIFLLRVILRIELIETTGFVSHVETLNDDDDEKIWQEQEEYIESIEDNAIKNYFKKALNEIQLLSSFNATFIDNHLPKTDSARHIKMVLEKKSASRLFDLMMDSGAPSFLLKYLQFNIGMSSGEIAFGRLTAYIDYVFKVKNHDNVERERPKHNVILMLDEPDVSLHPQAKTEFIKNLLYYVKTYMPNKNVQVMITSHSPIVLSDIPNKNVVYLKRENGGRTEVLSSEKRTFGSSIIDLYSDSFYFDNNLPIGSFARDSINEFYNQMKKTNQGENEELKEKIDLIGDELIRNKFNAKSKEKSSIYKESDLNAIELSIERILEQIKRMK